MEENLKGPRKVIVFQLGEEEYAVPVEQVGSIERLLKITRVPRAASFVKGVINLRGVVTPIINLRSRFGMEETEYTDQTRIIIINIDDIDVGLIVDVANDVIDVEPESIEPTPEVIGAVDVNYIDGVVNLEKRLLILLNLQKVLSDKEIESLKRIEG